MPPNVIKDRFDVLQHSLYSVVYGEKGDTQTVLKAGAIWVDGEPHGWRPLARNTSADLKREACIYGIIGPHDRVVSYICLEVNKESKEPWALRLERAPYGSLRQYIVKSGAPQMHERLTMAADFAEGVQHLHNRGVIWGDLSTRNALLFDGLRLKLCDFAGSRVEGVYDNITYGYEIRYRPPLPRKDCPPLGSMEQELFALGTAIYEITEWKVPYDAAVDDKEVDMALGRGEWPVLSDDNPARGIIQRCWGFQCASAQDAVDTLRAASNALDSPEAGGD